MNSAKLKSSIVFLIILFISTFTCAQVNFYRTNGGEFILSGADLSFNNTKVNTNIRFTSFFHGQQLFNMDLNKFAGLYTGIALRNIGLISEDLYQNSGFMGIDNTLADWNKNIKIKRRSYSVGFPFALKLGDMGKQVFLYGGGEIEYMFHYKQKLFIDGQKFKFSEWGSDRVKKWIPSLFAGMQFPGGINLKLKYYMDNFLDPAFTGIDFGENVDYSNFQTSGIWYISLSTVINKKNLQKMIGEDKEMASNTY